MRIILHAGWSDDRPFLWGERPRADVDREDVYPFAASADELTRTLAHLGIEDSNEEAQFDLQLQLPSADRGALPSSSIIEPLSSPPSRLASWTVPAQHLEHTTWMSLFRLGEKRVLQPGIFAGPDLTYLATVSSFGAFLVRNGQVIPAIVRREDNYLARWQVALTIESRRYFQRLTQRLPGACRAAGPLSSRTSVVRGMLDYVADGYMRTRAGAHRRSKKVPRHSSVHAAWLYRLGQEDDRIDYASGDCESLLTSWQKWARTIHAPDQATHRIALRLEEPTELEPQWYVRYLLQSIEGGRYEQLQRALGRGSKAALRTMILSALGQAAGLSEDVETSLNVKAPAGFHLDNEGAFRFLSDSSEALRTAGYDVLLPKWWAKGKRPRLAVRAATRTEAAPSSGTGDLTLDSVIRFSWQIALGGEAISLEELEELAKSKASLVQFRGKWVVVTREGVEAALDLLEKGERTATVAETMRMALGGAVDLPEGLVVEGVLAGGALEEWMARIDGRRELGEMTPPDSFEGTLRPYQARGLNWLGLLGGLGLGACLADDMGLGKTVQTLAWLTSLRQSKLQSKQETKPALLVCPTSVMGNWQKESARFAPEFDLRVHHGPKRPKGAKFRKSLTGADLCITSYALIHRDRKTLQSVDWGAVILDEAQMIKNAGTQQAKAARALRAPVRIGLTGTPVENSVGELWSLMEFLNPGLLGSASDFERDFLNPIQNKRDPAATRRLKRLTSPFILRRLKTDPNIISDLPDKTERKVYCQLTEEQAALYRAVVKEVEEPLESAEGVNRRGLVLATLSKLKQICNHPGQYLDETIDSSAHYGPVRSGKLSKATEIVDHVAESDERILIFTQYQRMGTLLKDHFEMQLGREAFFLHGGTSQKRRQTMVDRFMSDADGPLVFVLSIRAAGTGLNLTRANHVLHFDRWWNPAVENQATDRAFRIGQKKNVLVHKLICLGTLEERIDEMIEKKRTLAENVVGTSEKWLTEFSNEELRSLFSLEERAVEVS